MTISLLLPTARQRTPLFPTSVAALRWRDDHDTFDRTITIIELAIICLYNKKVSNNIMLLGIPIV